jgi:hypothetical protein
MDSLLFALLYIPIPSISDFRNISKHCFKKLIGKNNLFSVSTQELMMKTSFKGGVD